ncbi:hypothetical protein V1514DRAFT_330919 [Lipomyces japonicus]|uniref:uncharacterized protein n=1 Tax=Lipomyces japonicus TaxID=56871 RepID=UPI0034CE45D4
MIIRKPFAAALILLLFGTAYLGFAPLQLPNDKLLHFVVFFIITTVFYWVVDTTRRRLINATVVVCILFGGIGSEFVQSFVPSRIFDVYDIIANIAGSTAALLISTWYHKRLLDRKRATKYFALHSQETDLEAAESSELSNLDPTPLANEPEPAHPVS